MSTARGQLSGGVVNGKIYTIGGSDVASLTTFEEYTPPDATTSTTWSTLTAGGGASLGLKSGGYLVAWGNGWGGKLGLGDTTTRLTPTLVGTERDWAAVAAPVLGAAGTAVSRVMDAEPDNSCYLSAVRTPD